MQIQFSNLFLPIVLVLAKILIGNRILQQHPWLLIVISLAMAAAVFNVAFTALFGAREKITLENMRHVMVYNYNDKIKSIIVEFTLDDLLDEAEEEGLRRLREKIGEHIHEDSDAAQMGGDKSAVVKENLFASMARTWDDDSLLSRFQTLMVKEQLFLQPSLTLGDVADRLKTNKTYVSKLVNNTYNLGFPELLNTLRIDYAEQYIINHRSAKQDEIAAACGFLSASAFNSIFKKVTGVTPKVWIAGIREGKPDLQ
jgi:AraC-like DNA-binding protein